MKLTLKDHPLTEDHIPLALLAFGFALVGLVLMLTATNTPLNTLNKAAERGIAKTTSRLKPSIGYGFVAWGYLTR